MMKQDKNFPKSDCKHIEVQSEENECDDYEPNINYTEEYIITVISCLSMVNTKINCAWIGPILPQLLSGTFQIQITMEESVWVITLLNIGAIPGCLVASMISNKFGRKASIFLATIPFVTSALINIFAENILHYYIARFIGGFGDGVSFSVIPMYISEISSPKIRGTLASCIYMPISIGALFVYIVGAFLPIVTYSAVCAIFPIIQLIFTFYLPETPYFLVIKQDFNGVEKTLQFLRKKRNVSNELKRLTEGYEKENAENKQSFLDLFRDGTNLMSVLICTVVYMAQQWTGAVAIFGYSQVIFEDGHSSISAKKCGIFLAFMNFVLVFLCASLIDRFGRRVLLMASGIITILPLAILFGYFYLQDIANFEYIEKFRCIPLIGIVFFKFSVCIGLVEIPYIFTGKLFPTRVKTYATSLMSVTGSIIGVAANKMYQVVYTEFGYPAVFGMFIAWLILTLIFIYFMVPETKSLTLEEIQNKLRNSKQIKNEI